MGEVLSLLLLGALQGLTEFLPVSSSGHLVLFERLTGRHPDLSLNVGLHMGSLLAILWFYRRDLLDLLRCLPPRREAPPDEIRENRRLLGHLVLATAATAPLALTLQGPVEGLFSEPAAGRFLALTFSMTAAMLVLAHLTPAGSSRFSWKGALALGLVQGIAVFPGISRSGSTIAFALLLGIPREKAARFSFLLAIPVIGGAFLLEAPRLFARMDPLPVLAGLAAAAASGLLALFVLERLLRSWRFVWFAVYLIPLAILTGLFLP